MTVPPTGLQLLSLIKDTGELEISLVNAPVPQPKDHEVIVEVKATPINPSDLGLLVGAADLSTARVSTRDSLPVLTADVPAAGMRAMAPRVGEAMPVGNEGCGIVVAAGESAAAQAMIGKLVATVGGGMYAQYRCLPLAACMVLPDGTEPADGASCFVNPLTSLAFTEVMRNEGHSALVHTAAASNLGQMLVKICLADGIPLVNIVRSGAQAEILKTIGATHIVDSTSETFKNDLEAAVEATGATIGFDAIGGGKLSGQILSAMEIAAVKRMKTYSRYGSDEQKQMYIYGALDVGPTILNRSFGLTWNLGGFLLTPFLIKAGQDVNARMRSRVIAELTTTFKSHYSHEISLIEALDPAVMIAYNAKRTSEKFLIRP